MLIINQHVAMHHSLFPWHRILDVEDNDDNDEDDDDDDEDDDDDADDDDDDDNCINAIDDEYQPTCCDAPQFVSLAPNTGESTICIQMGLRQMKTRMIMMMIVMTMKTMTRMMMMMFKMA